MPSQSGRSIVDAFVDQSFPEGRTFCTQFLYSAEFSANTLKSLVTRGKSSSKYELASSLTDSLYSHTIDPEEVLLAFVQQPRKWLSFKLGSCKDFPTFETPNILLTEFGKECWYGPIKDRYSSRKWYIRTKKIPFYENLYKAENVLEGEIPQQFSSVTTHQIRWTVIAEIDINYVALSWNGFRHNELKGNTYEPQIESLMQFPYWSHIPGFFDELVRECKANWEHPVLDQFILYNLWDKYISNPKYVWRHLRIRADHHGVALNAHSTGAFDRESEQIRGLQALARQLAYSALDSLNIEKKPEVIKSVESSLLRTLIQEWETKSYEFSLDEITESELSELSNDNRKSLFRAHCYFANGISNSPQDALQHLNCFVKDYGGSSKALSFLLSELAK
ncbi:hypothetical protein V2H45_08760 [Tumidithrix elongata RA019]|uniref:Uncharacterized protein n=1 Tax=Tumidithrix elongata BACA0141 TaxID=2716417 RepID=A0AAW9Q0S7_9CYAN|nr:hypothetical protein [Tumidithrix elongata RA019]